jgi:hypothetical protein
LEGDVPKKNEAQEVSLELIEKSRGGARARSKSIARRGLPRGRKNQELSAKNRDAAQFRACRALLWDRERILHETGWSLQWLMSIEKFVADEDRRIWSETDARTLFATYRDQQFQIAAELEDLAEIFRGSKQYSALVSSLRTRADVLDRVVKTGQELGIIQRTAKQVEVSGQVDITQLDVRELRVHIEHQLSEVHSLLGSPASELGAGAAGAVKRLERNFAGEEREAIEVEAEPAPSRRKPGVKKIRRKKLAKPGTGREPGGSGAPSEE